MDKLSKWEYWADADEFRKIFGERMGNHLWEKFKESNNSVTSLYGKLDSENQEILVKHLKKKKVL